MIIKKQIVSAIIFSSMIVLPFMAQADVVSLQPLSSAVNLSPLSCFDFSKTIKMGSTGFEVRGLQFALMDDLSQSIDIPEYGTFGPQTLSLLNAFQQKYASEILKGGSGPTGIVGKMTRTKLNILYSCGKRDIPFGLSAKIPLSVILNVKNVSLDSNGVTVVFCNGSPTDIPVFPARVRLNGIIRDFNVPGATKSGACDTDTVPYSAWGLTYDPGSTYSVVTALDPNGIYKTAQTTYPLTATTTLSTPSVSGAHLSVRGIALKSTGLQGTVCNLGTADLPNYPVRITINGVVKDLDVPGVHTHGICQVVTWTYDMFGFTPAVGTIISATINIDPNNIIQETNEFDNSATIMGSI